MSVVGTHIQVEKSLHLGLIFIFYFMSMSILSVYISVHHGHAWCPWEPDRALDPLGLALKMFVSCHVVVRN